MTALPAANFFDQIDDLPALMADQTPEIARAIADALSESELRAIRRVIIIGDGDSYHAARAAEMAFETVAGVACEPYSAQRFLDYKAAYSAAGAAGTTLLIAISASGTTRRVIESLERARRPGVLSLGLTTRAGSALTNAADRAAVLTLPDKSLRPGPGLRSFHANLLGLYLLADRLGHALGRTGTGGAAAELAALAPTMAATLDHNGARARAVAEAHADADCMMWLGSGPSYGSAIFAAAKVVEAAGVLAIGQDLEEWSHVEFFAGPLDYPVIVIAPPGNSHWRAIETAEMARTYGHRVAAVIRHDDAQTAAHCDHVLPVMGDVREAYSPLLYTPVSAQYAAWLTASKGRALMQSDNPDFREKNRRYQMRDRIRDRIR